MEKLEFAAQAVSRDGVSQVDSERTRVTPPRPRLVEKQGNLEFAALVKFAGKIGVRRPGRFLLRFAHVATADLGRLDLGPLPWSGRDHAIY